MSHHRFHGDPTRFEVVADFVVERFPDARYVADVAGGQGMLARLLAKRHNLEAEVVDPRGWRLKGVSGREEEYTAAMADYYDLVIGLHPDQALREVVLSAERVAGRRRPVLQLLDARAEARPRRAARRDRGAPPRPRRRLRPRRARVSRPAQPRARAHASARRGRPP